MDYKGRGCANSRRKPASHREAGAKGPTGHPRDRRSYVGQARRCGELQARTRWEACRFMIEEIRALLAKCSEEERRQVFDELRGSIQIHPFEARMNARAEVILEALDRAGDLTLRGIRGIIGEATFVREIVPKLSGWEDVTPPGDLPYDCAVIDRVATVKVQIKMQRRAKGVPWLRNELAVVEVQRTRGGKRGGEDTRPYRFGEFDLLGVCMEPSHARWNSFHYAPERWLIPRAVNPALIEIMQPVSLVPDAIWTNDFDEAVRRLRSGEPRPDLVG